MKCRICGGNFSATTVLIRTGCDSALSGQVCEECGRVHWMDGEACYNRRGNAYFIIDGEENYDVSEENEKKFAEERKASIAIIATES